LSGATPRSDHRAQALTTKHVEVKVFDCLSGVITLVNGETVPALSYTFAHRHLHCDLEHGANHAVEIIRQAFKIREMIIRDHQQVDRSFGLYIPYHKTICITV